MINLNNLTKETLVEIIQDLDYELERVYNEGFQYYENTIIRLQEELEDSENRRKYWKKKALGNFKRPERTLNAPISAVNVMRPAEKKKVDKPLVIMPKVIPTEQRAQEEKPRTNNQGGNWLGTEHIQHKSKEIGFRAEFQHDVKNRKGEVVVHEGDIYEFPTLKSVENFYIGKNIKKPNWRANNLSTAITRRGGYMDSAIWEYIEIEGEE